MAKNNQAHKKIEKLSIVIKKILNILRKLNHIEKTGDRDNDFFVKHIDLLQELIEHEKNLCEKLCSDPNCEQIILEIIENPSKFQAAQNIKGQAFSRLFRNMFIYNRQYEKEANINILNTLPELSHLEFRFLDEKHAPLFNAFSEDLFNVFMRILDKKITASEGQMRDDLLDEKYKIFINYANTNKMLIKQEEKESSFTSQMTQVMNEVDIDERVEAFLLADFSYNLGDEFLENMLQIDNKLYNEVDKQKTYQMRFILLESLLVLGNYEMREQLENLFYKKQYEMMKNSKKNNKMADDILQVILQAKTKNKIITI